MPRVDGLPRAKQFQHLEGLDVARTNNQFVLRSPDLELLTPEGTVMLEYVQGTNFVVQDANGVAVTGTIPSALDLAYAPLRLDGGVKLTGTVLIAKGYVVPLGKPQEV